MAGGTNSSRFLAGMYSVDIAEYPVLKCMSNKMQQRSLKQQLLVWTDYASDPLNLGRPKSCEFIGRIEESLLCFVLWPQTFCLICRWPSNTPLPLFQSQCHYLTVPATWRSTTTWRSMTAQGSRMRHLQCQNARLVCSSLCLPAGQSKHHLCTLRIRRGQVKGLPKPLFSSDRARRPKCLPWK